MSLHHVYSDSTGSTLDITDRVRTPGAPATSYSVRDDAEEASTSISQVTIDDPLGDLLITGHRRMYSYEDEAPAGDQLVHNGFTFGERVIRGPNRQGAGRQWVVTLLDVNTLLNRRVMNGEDADRPAETDTERMLALMGMTELNTVDDDSMISLTAAAVMMDAVSYIGQNVGQYVDDCRQASGKNAYIWYNETLGQYGIWYDFDYSTEFDSGCFLTTDEAQEVDYVTTFGYSIDRTYIEFDPTRVISGGFMEGPFGTLYDQNAATIDTFAAIDRAIPAENVKTLTAAQYRMDRYLADGSTEEPIIHTVMTKVPRSKVNAVKKGYLVNFKAEWGPGFESYVQGRVLYRHVTEITEDPVAGYEIEMDISPIATAVTPHAVLYRAQSDNAYPSQGINPCILSFFRDGDDPTITGYPHDPTIGPITIIPGTTPGGRGGNNALRFDAAGTNITFESMYQVNGALNGNIQTVEILLNGSLMGLAVGDAIGTCIPAGNNGCFITIDGTIPVVAPGDELTWRYTKTGTTDYYIDSVNFTITGGSLGP